MKAEIEATLPSGRPQQLALAMIGMYNYVRAILENEQTNLLSDENKDAVRAWDQVLKQVGIKSNRDMLLGILFATGYEQTKTT